MDALLNSLGETERGLLRETEPERLADLDEEALVDLHRRIRRARNKYSKIYRRHAAQAVSKKGGRGMARPRNARNAGRAELFEDALARVSEALAVAARHSAEQLRTARLEAANRPGTWPGSQEGPEGSDGTAAQAQVSDRRPKGPGRKKRNASTVAAGKRRQAKRDKRR